MKTNPANVHQWLKYFEANRHREDLLPWHHAVRLDDPLHRALTRTLQRFNLGESGEGRWLKQWAAQNGDEDYCRAIALFVAEEQAHSRWFGMLLGKIDEPVLEGHWSDSIFTRVRRAGGLHFELVTFLTAEIVGKQLFAAVARRCPDPLVTAVFRQIVKDESAHIAFHVATLRAAFAAQAGWKRALWRVTWGALVGAALALVCVDHAPLFRALGVSRLRFAHKSRRDYVRVAGQIWKASKRAPGTTARWQWD